MEEKHLTGLKKEEEEEVRVRSATGVPPTIQGSSSRRKTGQTLITSVGIHEVLNEFSH